MTNNSAPNTEELSEVEKERSKLLQIPPTRVKSILKMDPDFSQHVTNEALFMITRATELFTESLTLEAYTYTTQAKKKTLQKRDVELAVDAVDSLMFLDGVSL